ncbi:MAG: MBL fold metallo-hydrolase [Deltaproteobacteria bacterium]|nr:MBL fold metallo-hydrolase [Deltaproteobacteria bacterium]MBW2137253.1 MBL fold metallo-hydrolase [Deltaproteobacteria bacterium]
MRIRFWGTRGSIPVPGRNTIEFGGNTTCLEITLQTGKRLIIDAGTGIRELGSELKREEGPTDLYLLITHIHWDHIIGFPFFEPLYDLSTRIRIDGYPTCMKGLRSTFDTRMGDGFFPIKFDDLRAEVQYLDRISKGEVEFEGVTVDRIPLQHPQGGYGFRFREDGKTLVFITDNELRSDAWTGRTLEEYVEFCTGADILIHDAQYLPSEINQREGWGHSDYEAAFMLAREAGVKKLVLFHHDPSRTDLDVAAIQEACREIAAQKNSYLMIEAARENSELLL